MRLEYICKKEGDAAWGAFPEIIVSEVSGNGESNTYDCVTVNAIKNGKMYCALHKDGSHGTFEREIIKLLEANGWRRHRKLLR